MAGEKMPVVFATDMGPDPALVDRDYALALSALGRELPRPEAIVIMSGHWPAGRELKLTSSSEPRIIHDYGGFPRELYDRGYPCAGAPELAARAASLLKREGLPASLDATRGLDHGAWAPLRHVYPAADVPVVQLTVPAGWKPSRIADAGRALSSLREEGVLLIASGSLVHNLAELDWGGAEALPWAAEFDAWLEPRLDGSPLADLLDYRRSAPHGALAAPTTEHFDPLFFALGAAEGEPLTRRYRKLTMGSALMLLFTLGRPLGVKSDEAESIRGSSSRA